MDGRHAAWPRSAPLDLEEENRRLTTLVQSLEARLQKSEKRRRALIHILSDMQATARRMNDERAAMAQVLAERDEDRSRLAQQAVRLDNSRRALLHILQDVHLSNERLERSRKAMIHIMGSLRETTEQVQHREHELKDKQEQLVQAGKLATLGELTTGIAHELNNPLNNIGLFLGNIMDHVEANQVNPERILRDLRSAMQQVRKATTIITHLRTFGRAAPVSRQTISINDVVRQAVSLVQEQLRLHQVDVQLELAPSNPLVSGSAIQLEQVFINLLTNARDAVAKSVRKQISVQSIVIDEVVKVIVSDTGPGIPSGMEQRIFDPFFSTKDVGAGTGLGLSITYGILKDHEGSISVQNRPGEGATFIIQLPLTTNAQPSSSAS